MTKRNHSVYAAPVELPQSTVQQLCECISELETEKANVRRLDETIRRNSRLFEAMFVRSNDGFLLMTPQMTFLKMVHSILGNSNQNLVGRSLLSIVHPEDQAQVSEEFSRLLDDPAHTVTCECRVADKDGEWCWLEIDMTDMLDDPDVGAIVFNSRNITLRKKYEASLRELESHGSCGGCCSGKNTDLS